MRENSCCLFLTIIRLAFSTSRYLDYLLNIDTSKKDSKNQESKNQVPHLTQDTTWERYFVSPILRKVSQIYSTEIQLSEANYFDIEALFLDASLLTGFYIQHALWPYIDFVKLIILVILSKFN